MFDLLEFFLGPQPKAHNRDPEVEAAEARAAGLEVVELRTERLRMEFFDVGAVVYFLRKVIRTAPDFTVEDYRDRPYRHSPFRCCSNPVPVISTEGAGACPPGPDARLAAIRRLLLDETLAPGDRIAGCLVALYGQQVSRIAALRTTDTSCAAGATRLKLGADWLDVPEPVATLLREHLRNRGNMTTAANPASSWLFPGQLAGEHRSYRRLVRVLHQLGIPARASRLAAWRELVRNAPPAVLADALGVSPGTAMRHAFLGGADWSAYAARRRAHTPDNTS